MRKLFDPKREEVTVGWRKIHKEELQVMIYIYHQILFGRSNQEE